MFVPSPDYFSCNFTIFWLKLSFEKVIFLGGAMPLWALLAFDVYKRVFRYSLSFDMYL